MQTYYLPILSSNILNSIDMHFLKYVSYERKEKIKRYRHISDQKLSLYAGILVRMVLSQILGIPHSELQFHYKKNHKPQFLSSFEYDFSISHTHDAILCCISSDGLVGADIEKIDYPPYEIMQEVYHPDEKEYVLSAPRNNKSKRFYEIWTRKEAYTKFLGVGLAYDLLSCNTLSSSFAKHFYTWQQDNYLCSIYSDYLNNNTIHLTSEKDVHNFFLNNK